jgi:putative acetyltransferase
MHDRSISSKIDTMNSKIEIREIQPADNPAVAKIIRGCLEEYGAVGPGFAWADPEVDSIYETYLPDRWHYLVLQNPDGLLLGGGGIGRLQGGDESVCELQKMYFTPEIRGFGWGKKVLQDLLEKAVEFRYEKCYLETLKRMDAANGLYRKFGFVPLHKPMGNTGHCSCDFWYVKDLRDRNPPD